jgi:hypothetical protein
MSHHISSLKNNYKKSRKSPHTMSSFSIENNSGNLRSMVYHISPLKNNFKNLRKSHHPTSPFSIENNSKNSKKMYFSKLVPQL